MHNTPQQQPGQIELPNPQATAAAKKAALINISLALVQLDATKIAPKAQTTFGNLHNNAAKILLEVLDEYEFTEKSDGKTLAENAAAL